MANSYWKSILNLEKKGEGKREEKGEGEKNANTCIMHAEPRYL